MISKVRLEGNPRRQQPWKKQKKAGRHFPRSGLVFLARSLQAKRSNSAIFSLYSLVQELLRLRPFFCLVLPQILWRTALPTGWGGGLLLLRGAVSSQTSLPLCHPC